MDIKAVERKWQGIWEKTKCNNFDPKSDKPKHYVLEMFSYPSGAKLHIGHWYNYGPTDSIKTGVHPKDSTEKNIETMEGQLRAMGAMFDWSAEIKTCDESYYKWTQWMFLQLYKKGLAYRKEAPVNWCPSCQTVLANEQVVENCCDEKEPHAVVLQDHRICGRAFKRAGYFGLARKDQGDAAQLDRSLHGL